MNISRRISIVIESVLSLCLILSACGTNSAYGPRTNNPLRVAIEASIREEISNLRTLYGLDDLSYELSIYEQEYDTLATGEVIFISDKILDMEPSEQYSITQKIGKHFFTDLDTHIKVDGYTFIVKHGDGYSVWRTTSGDRFISSYFDLKKNGQIIYDNPDNDLQQQIEDDLGMTYEEYIEQSKNESTPSYSIVDPKAENDDFWFAVTAAQKLVKDELKSPSTAKFPYDESVYTAQRSGDDWIVSGYVDSQNGFGATIRTNWIATFTMGDTSGSTYKVSNYEVSFP